MRKIFLALAVFALFGNIVLQALVMAQAQPSWSEGVACPTEGMKRSCGTAVGACEKGERTCIQGEKGLKWSEECIGGIGPAEKEIPSNSLDDDCNGLVDEGGFNLLSLGLIGAGVVFMVVALIISRMG